MKVLYFFRKQRQGVFSIETVFELIRKGLGNAVTAESFYSSGNVFRDFRKTRKLTADVFHITGHIHFFSLFLPASKTVLTVHDVGHYENTLKGIKKWIYGFIWFYLPLRKLNYITAISQFTKDRMLANFNVSPDKIRVIYDPVNPQYQKSERAENQTPVILQIGSGHNKNVDRLIEAARGMKCKLHFINKLNPSIIRKLNQYNISFEQQYHISEQDLLKAYQQADVLYFASTYEGFGLPIIEAQACGVPVITSNFGAMIEIGENGKSVCLVDPFSVTEIQAAIEKIITDKQYRSVLIENGLINAKRFSHKEISAQYLKLYESVNG